MANIIIHCYYSGEEEAVCGFIEEMLDSVRQDVLGEDGCMQYDYFFSAEDRANGLLLEKWRDDAALSRHANGEPMRRLQEIKARYGLQTRVERYVLKD